jgi:hypothetical protein
MATPSSCQFFLHMYHNLANPFKNDQRLYDKVGYSGLQGPNDHRGQKGSRHMRLRIWDFVDWVMRELEN